MPIICMPRRIIVTGVTRGKCGGILKCEAVIRFQALVHLVFEHCRCMVLYKYCTSTQNILLLVLY